MSYIYGGVLPSEPLNLTAAGLQNNQMGVELRSSEATGKVQHSERSINNQPYNLKRLPLGPYSVGSCS